MKKDNHPVSALLPLGAAGVMGVGTEHDANDPTDYWLRGYYVLMVFHTDFEAETHQGRKRGKAGQMLINGPDFHHWHRGVDGQGYRNDWLHIKESVGKQFMGFTDLPLNEIFTLSRSDFFGDRIRAIEKERLENAPNNGEMISGLVREIFLLSDRYRKWAQQRRASPAEQNHYQELCRIRSKMHEEYQRKWEIEAMARQAHLSSNRFSVLYKKFFNLAPLEDLMARRIEQAKLLLLSGQLSVGEVAHRTGFSNSNYFSRVFRSKTGYTASAYLASHGKS